MNDSNLPVNPFLYGSAWMRADFHLHTRADKEFIYTGEENSFVNDYVQALKQANIQIGVITNHNKFNYGQFKGLREAGLKENIFLLAGVELSVNDGANGIHTLVVFSDAWFEKGDYINPFLTSTFSRKIPSDYEQENGRSSDSLLETIKKLESYHKDFFLVFAHVENRSGLWEELKGGRLEELAQDKYFRRNCLGFQKVRTYDKPDKKCRVKVKRWFKDWYPAEVEGCDCKTIEQIGNGKECYLKIGDFNFSAVKQALMDYQHRVAKEKLSYTHSYIKSISFTGGVLDGKIIHLSPELNTLIGIRGSGKSFIIEALRYGLNISFVGKESDVDYKEELLNNLLGGSGKITIQAINRFGQVYEIRRILNQAPDVYKNGILQTGISISETILNTPIYFGQKDLSNSGNDNQKGSLKTTETFEKSLVEKFIKNKLTDVRLDISTQQDKVKSAVQQLQKLDNIEEKIQEWKNKKQNSEHQLKLYQDYAIEDKLQKKLDFENDSQQIIETNDLVNQFISELKTVFINHEENLKKQSNYQSKQNQVFFDDFYTRYNIVIEFINSTNIGLSNLKKLVDNLELQSKDFTNLKESLKEDFAEIERKLIEELKEKGISQAINLSDFHKTKKVLNQANRILTELYKQKKQSEQVLKTVQIELKKLNKLWKNEFKLIEIELEKINKNHLSLEIKIDYRGDKKHFKQEIQDTFRGSNIRETNYQKWTDNYMNFEGMYFDISNISMSLNNNSDKFYEIFQKNLAALLTTQIKNKFIK